MNRTGPKIRTPTPNATNQEQFDETVSMTMSHNAMYSTKKMGPSHAGNITDVGVSASGLQSFIDFSKDARSKATKQSTMTHEKSLSKDGAIAFNSHTSDSIVESESFSHECSRSLLLHAVSFFALDDFLRREDDLMFCAVVRHGYANGSFPFAQPSPEKDQKR